MKRGPFTHDKQAHDLGYLDPFECDSDVPAKDRSGVGS